MSYYAVRVGRNPGIYHTWDECQKQVNKYSGAQFKKFASENEAKAFLKNTTSNNIIKSVDKVSSITIINDNMFDITTNVVIAFIDGACRNNQNRELARGSYGVVFPKYPEFNSARLLEGEKQTNIRAEYSALLLCLQQVDKMKLKFKKIIIRVYSDSDTLVKTINQYLPQWKRNNFKDNTIKNRDLVDKIDEEIRKRIVRISHIYGHQKGDDYYAVNNRAVDELCNRVLREVL